MAYTLIVTGRARKHVELDAHGDPVVKTDTSPLRLEVSNAAAECQEARFLVPELSDAPAAVIQVEGKTKQSLHDWLAGHKCIAPRSAPGNVATPEVKPEPQLGQPDATKK